MAEFEQRYLHGESIAHYFDLIAGTSTGGIIGLGLAAGYTATEICNIYRDRGGEIFPPSTFLKPLRAIRGTMLYRYSRSGLSNVLSDVFQETTLADARVRLCIPSFEGLHGEVYVFKTPHHPDFRLDRFISMRTVAEATSAAPTFFRSVASGGYHLLDGGIWANNPSMVALVDVLSCFNLPRRRVRILSLGCGDQRPRISRFQRIGGVVQWRNVIFAAMELQSQNALGQAGLLIGADRLIRVTPSVKHIALDDWRSACKLLPPDAHQAAVDYGERVSNAFLYERAIPYVREPASEAMAPDTN